MTTTELFQKVPQLLSKDRKPPIEGWTKPEKGVILAAAVLALRPEIVVTLGVFGGGSVLAMALALRANGKGQILAVDPWSNEEAVKGQTGEHLDWWSKVNMAVIEAGFRQAVLAEGVSNQVVILKQTSDATKPPQSIGLLEVDGNHGEQAFRDIKRFGTKVKLGGLIFCDDVSWPGGAVGRGVQWLLSQGFIQLYEFDGGAMFQRIGDR